MNKFYPHTSVEGISTYAKNNKYIIRCIYAVTHGSIGRLCK